MIIVHILTAITLFFLGMLCESFIVLKQLEKNEKENTNDR